MNTFFDQEDSFSKTLFLSFLFALAYAQSPLFSSNQNTYFLHGLAQSGQGFLKGDWMAKSADPFPLFSFLVEQSSSFLPTFFFHIYYLVLLVIFMMSALGIAVEVWSFRHAKSVFAYFLLITALFSLLFSFASSNLLGFDLSHLFQNGLAHQYLLGRVFQPSSFGVFLLLSIYLFLKKKHVWSILALAVAVNFHATYLLSAAVLTLAYLLILFKEKRKKKALAIGVLSLLLALPSLIYSYATFANQPQESILAAQKILIDFRIPHHAKVEKWFGIVSLFKISLILLAAFLVRKKREIYLIMAVPFSIALLLSLLQVVTQSYFLALLFPWRVSVVLVPLSVFVLGGALVERLSEHSSFQFLWGKNSNIAYLILICIFVLSGVISFFLQYKNDTQRRGLLIEEEVARTKKPSSEYLIPPELERFRLGSKAAIFVDKKSHPYKADEVRDWYKRLTLANRFYAEENADCTFLEHLMDEKRLTHVVDERLLNCPFLILTYSDSDFKLFEKRLDVRRY